MRKFFLGLVLFIAFVGTMFAIGACDAEEELGSLEDFSKPYTGIYLCEKLTLSGEDKLDLFEYIRLELKYSGAFTIGYKMKSGPFGSLGGRYDMDTENENITFRAKQGVKSVTRTFPVESGVILVEENVLGRLLYAEFKME